MITEYRKFVINKLKDPADQPLLNAILGLAGESGECCDLLKKTMFHGHPFEFSKMVEELGDVRFYLEYAAEAIGVSMEYIEAMNVNKLNLRYPDGFDAERSMKRRPE